MSRKVCLLSHRTVPNEAGNHRAAIELPRAGGAGNRPTGQRATPHAEQRPDATTTRGAGRGGAGGSFRFGTHLIHTCSYTARRVNPAGPQAIANTNNGLDTEYGPGFINIR